MNTKKSVEITVSGRKYRLAVDEGEDSLVRSIAAQIDESVRTARAQGASEVSAAILVALQFGIKEAQTQEALAGRTQRVEALLSLL